jgi:hypothetical protein
MIMLLSAWDPRGETQYKMESVISHFDRLSPGTPFSQSISCYRASTFVKMALPPKVYQVGDLELAVFHNH